MNDVFVFKKAAAVTNSVASKKVMRKKSHGAMHKSASQDSIGRSAGRVGKMDCPFAIH